MPYSQRTSLSSDIEFLENNGGVDLASQRDPLLNPATPQRTKELPTVPSPKKVEQGGLTPTSQEKRNATFESGVSRGIDNLHSTLYALGAMATNSVDWDEATDYMMKGYESNLSSCNLWLHPNQQNSLA